MAVIATAMNTLVALRACRRWLRAQGAVLAGDLGELSRLGALRMAVSRQSTDPKEIGRRLLVDHSEQKSGGTEEMFGVRLPVVNPFRCFRGRDLRLLVLFSLLCRRRLQRELVAIAVAGSLRRQLEDSSETYLWNPGNLVAFAVAQLVPNVHVYVLAPEYPLVERAVAVYSNRTVLEIQKVNTAARRIVVREHNFVDDQFKFVFYPTQLAALEEEGSEEVALLRLLQCVARVSSIPVEVRLHYHDLCRPLPPGLQAQIGHLVPKHRRPSLLALSSHQVSFSCQSSIGYELLGLGVAHMIIGPRPGGSRERVSAPGLNAWFSSSTSVLPWDSVDDGWVDRFSTAYPERSSWSGKSLALDGRRIASW